MAKNFGRTTWVDSWACRLASWSSDLYCDHVTKAGRAEAVAERVIEAAAAAGLTTLGLSERTGIPHPTLRRRLYFRPELFTVDELAGIAEVTGVTFAWLACGEQVAA